MLQAPVDAIDRAHASNPAAPAATASIKQAGASVQLPCKLRAADFYDLQSLKRYKAGKADNQPSRALPPLPFKNFKTQKAAFDFLDQHPCSHVLRLFAHETASSGQREFIVTSAELFWKHYIDLPLHQRHHYEIIRQAQPCNLYFDLEFYPEFNPGVNGSRLVELLVSGVQELLQELFDVPWDPRCVVELDSSTPSKFSSRHLIFCLPGRAFANACHVGRFARRVLLRQLAKGVHCSQFAYMLVANKDGALTSFVDMGVYTRNRAFRLYLSSKFGKSAVLRLTHRFGGATRCPKAAFLDSLISVLPPEDSGSQPSRQPAEKMPCFGAMNSTRQRPADTTGDLEPVRDSLPPGYTQSGIHSSSQDSKCNQSDLGSTSNSSRALSLLYVQDDGQQQLLLLPASWQHIPMLQLRPLQHMQPGAPSAFSNCDGAQPMTANILPCSRESMPAAWQLSSSSDPCQPNTGPSPFPLLDRFIGSVCNVGGVQGEVRSWLGQPGSSCVVYNIKGNRWCGNLGRAHKSNGIFYCVDLSTGVFYQKCYDPECRQYRSNYMPLPADVRLAYQHMQAPCTPQAEQQAVQQQQHATPPKQQHAVQQQHATPPQQQHALPQQQHAKLPDWQQATHQQHAAQPQQQHATQHQQQQVTLHHTDDGPAAPDDDFDDDCLQLLLQVEQQRQHSQAVCPGTNPPQQLCNGHSEPAGAGVDDKAAGSQADDDWCFQVLQEVEAGYTQRHHVSAS